MPSDSASKVVAVVHLLWEEPLEFWARTLYWYWLKGCRASLASMNSNNPLDQINTSNSSCAPIGRLQGKRHYDKKSATNHVLYIRERLDGRMKGQSDRDRRKQTHTHTHTHNQ